MGDATHFALKNHFQNEHKIKTVAEYEEDQNPEATMDDGAAFAQAAAIQQASLANAAAAGMVQMANGQPVSVGPLQHTTGLVTVQTASPQAAMTALRESPAPLQQGVQRGVVSQPRQQHHWKIGPLDQAEKDRIYHRVMVERASPQLVSRETGFSVVTIRNIIREKGGKLPSWYIHTASKAPTNKPMGEAQKQQLQQQLLLFPPITGPNQQFQNQFCMNQ